MIRIRIQDPGLPCISLLPIKCHGLRHKISCLCVKCNVCLCWWVVVYVLNALSYFQIPSYLSVLGVNWQGLEKVEMNQETNEFRNVKMWILARLFWKMNFRTRSIKSMWILIWILKLGLKHVDINQEIHELNITVQQVLSIFIQRVDA